MAVSPIREETVNKQTAARRAIVPQSYAWSSRSLAEACLDGGIAYEESAVFASLRGVIVRCGKTIILCVRAALEDREKIFTIGHELAHLALNYMPSDPIVFFKDTSTPQILQDSQKELEADIWAAHLLVFPEVYEQELEAGRTREEAMIHTANRLNIPARVVDLWLRYRDWQFAEAPSAWFARTCGQPAVKEEIPAMAERSKDLESQQGTLQQVVLRLARSFGVKDGKSREAVRKSIGTDQALQHVWIHYHDTCGRPVGQARISIDWDRNRVLAQFGEQEPCRIDLTRPLQRQMTESSSRHAAQLEKIRAACTLKRPEISCEYRA